MLLVKKFKIGMQIDKPIVFLYGKLLKTGAKPNIPNT